MQRAARLSALLDHQSSTVLTSDNRRSGSAVRAAGVVNGSLICFNRLAPTLLICRNQEEDGTQEKEEAPETCCVSCCSSHDSATV